jgi:hypothetical protein
MSVLFHFVYSVVKIAALGTIYSTLILLTVKFISYLTPDSWIDKLTRDKFKFWKSTAYIFIAGLFIFSFTYWGDHGHSGTLRLSQSDMDNQFTMETDRLHISTPQTINNDIFMATALEKEGFVQNKTIRSI